MPSARGSLCLTSGEGAPSWEQMLDFFPVNSALSFNPGLGGGLGGSVTHRCFYTPTPANKHQHKFWCRIARNGLCYTIITSNSHSWGEYEGRVTLGDVPEKAPFRLSPLTGLSILGKGTGNVRVNGFWRR
uniref:Uncharacterized protein n=1 Tax=Malurus cyaneus samueli TaxID=2593467 RepID=A0A8C5TVP1_9PASS